MSEVNSRAALRAIDMMLACTVMLVGYQAVQAQSSDQMQQWLNQVEQQPGAWPQPPAVETPPTPAAVQPALGAAAAPAAMQAYPMPQSAGQAASGNPFNLSRRDILRMFLGGSANPPGAAAAANGQAAYNAQNYLQTARDEAAQAEVDERRARYDSDKSQKQSAASSAQYHANAARAAANSATAAASGASPDAANAAAQARNAADRAQAAADRASANANGGGW